jgi:hypothetical protein
MPGFCDNEAATGTFGGAAWGQRFEPLNEAADMAGNDGAVHGFVFELRPVGLMLATSVGTSRQMPGSTSGAVLIFQSGIR